MENPAIVETTKKGVPHAEPSIGNLLIPEDEQGKYSPPEVFHNPRSSCPAAESASAASSTTPGSLGNSSAEVPVRKPVDDSRTSKDRYGSAIKLLVSNNAAGSIIGRAGQTISELQTESGSRIKLSQAGDYYPGSQDRVCLIQGEYESVKIGLRLLLERLYMMQETMNTPAWHQYRMGAAVQPFDFTVRLLVPATSCGMIIGKNGANIKYMEETSGVTSIRLSPKEDGIYNITMERVVTITGNALQSCLTCVFLIVDGMTSHPEISRYTNMTTSYANVSMSALYGSAPISSPGQPPLVMQPAMLQPPSPHQRRAFWDPNVVQTQPSGISRRSISSPDLLNIAAATPHLHGLQPNFRAIPQPIPSPENAEYREQSEAFAFHHNPFSSLQVPPPPIQEPQQSVNLMPRNSIFEGQLFGFSGAVREGMTAEPSPSSVSHSASAPNLLAAQFEQSLHISPSSSHLNTHHSQLSSAPTDEYDAPTLVPQAPTMIAPGCFTAQVLVPDTMIGSILGRGGRTLNELQMMSGTRIRISQRGEYMPGTRSRIVAIRGPTAQAVWNVQYMISQRMVLPPTAVYQMPASVSFDNLQQLSGAIAEDARGLQ